MLFSPVFAKFQQRLGHQPALPRSNVLSVRLIQAIPFQTITHSFARRPAPIPFSFNHFRTLFIVTEGVPSLPSHFAQFWCNLNPFRNNTSGTLRMCCKQKTYAIAKPFRCNTYKKPGVGGLFSFPSPPSARNPGRLLVRRQGRSHGHPHALVQYVPLFQGILGSIDRLEEFDDDLSWMNDQRPLLHDAMCARTSHGDNGHARLNRHYDRALLKFLKPPIRTSRAFGVDQERLPGLESFRGLFNAGDCRVACASIDGDKMRRRKRLPHDRPLEQGFLQENSDSSWDCTNDRRRIGRARVVRGKEANARGDTLEALHAHPDAYSAHKKHHSLYTGPINRIRIACDQSIDEQRRPDEQNVQGQEDANKKSPKHRQANSLESQAAGQAKRGCDCIPNEPRLRWSLREASPLECGAPSRRRAHPRRRGIPSP